MSGDEMADPCAECGGRCCSFDTLRMSFVGLEDGQRYDSFLIDDAWLAQLPFEDGEIPDMRWYVGRYPETGNRGLFFECQHLQEDGTCGAYERRPAMCKNFACQALRGEESLEDFLESTTWDDSGREELVGLREVTDRVQEIIEREVTLEALHEAHEDAGWQEQEAEA
jgi:Fe-S-cluster containining protein